MTLLRGAQWNLAILGLACLSGAAGAQAVVDAPVVARDSTARMVRVGDGVYAILHDDATTDWPDGTTIWPHGNTGVVVGEHGILVIDATYLPSRAEADYALIRQVSDRPVRWLVNTHWHGDHTHGNGAWQSAVPELQILGPRGAQELMALNLVRVPRLFTAAGGETRQRLARFEALLASGRDSTGRSFTPAERASLARVVSQHREEQRELARVVSAAPTTLFDGRMQLDLGGRVVEIVDRGTANSPHDVTVEVSDAAVLFAGDLLVHPVPYAFGVSPLTWITVLHQLESVPIRALVPGHGPVFANHAYTTQVRELLEAVRDRVRARLLEGSNLAGLRAQPIDLSDLRARFVRQGDVNAGLYFDDSIGGSLIESMVPCLTGSRC